MPISSVVKLDRNSSKTPRRPGFATDLRDLQSAARGDAKAVARQTTSPRRTPKSTASALATMTYQPIGPSRPQTPKTPRQHVIYRCAGQRHRADFRVQHLRRRQNPRQHRYRRNRQCRPQNSVNDSGRTSGDDSRSYSSVAVPPPIENGTAMPAMLMSSDARPCFFHHLGVKLQPDEEHEQHQSDLRKNLQSPREFSETAPHSRPPQAEQRWTQHNPGQVSEITISRPINRTTSPSPRATAMISTACAINSKRAMKNGLKHRRNTLIHAFPCRSTPTENHRQQAHRPKARPATVKTRFVTDKARAAGKKWPACIVLSVGLCEKSLVFTLALLLASGVSAGPRHQGAGLQTVGESSIWAKRRST